MKKERKHWISIKKATPNFQIFGFHVRKLRVKLKDGSEEECYYQGYGEYSRKGLKLITKEVTHWECDVEGCGIV